jgi:hypothetical protein
LLGMLKATLAKAGAARPMCLEKNDTSVLLLKSMHKLSANVHTYRESERSSKSVRGKD